MNKQGKRIRQDSLAHHKRMFKWVKSLPDAEREELPSRVKMHGAIGENWKGIFCAHCNNFGSLFSCERCPLSKNGCCNGLWLKLYNSRTWNEWLKWDKKIIKYIKRHG